MTSQIAGFIGYIIYVTVVFFIPSWQIVVFLAVCNLLAAVIFKVNFKRFCLRFLKLLPFIIVVFLFNFLFGDAILATFITFKLAVACQITLIYAEVTSIYAVAGAVAFICRPFRVVGLNETEVKLTIIVSLTILPLLRQDLRELKLAFRTKAMRWNLSTYQVFLKRFLEIAFLRMEELELALISKTEAN